MADEPRTEQPEDEQEVELQGEVLEASSVEQELDEAVELEQDLSRLLEEAKSKADENWDQLIRARAELDNVRRRQQKELENAHKFGIEKFVRELLPIKDSLELGLTAAQDGSADVTHLLQGTEMTLTLFANAMEKFAIVEVNPAGEPFNPEFHQAMSMVPSPDVEPNTVITVIQKGYTLNGRLVRPAMVMVSQAPVKPIDEQA
ncbi:MAG: nucleotide exchange factor GrpE [Candidatus Polarisedimenticolaceae bacterium]|nr:nucleotide exchange factor GrpE [Candidatus Polarisedimenticolaceae bacterium]